MIYNTKSSKAGISVQVCPSTKTYICLNDNSGNRLDNLEYKAYKDHWTKSPEDYWIYLGPPTLTEWSE